MSIFIQKSISDTYYNRDFNKTVNKITQKVNTTNFLNSRYQTVLVSIQLYSDNLFDGIQSLHKLVIVSITKALSGDFPNSKRVFCKYFLEELHHIKKAVTLPLIFLAAMAAPKTVWNATSRAFPYVVEADV